MKSRWTGVTLACEGERTPWRFIYFDRGPLLGRLAPLKCVRVCQLISAVRRESLPGSGY
jgi:hypothetical protein